MKLSVDKHIFLLDPLTLKSVFLVLCVMKKCWSNDVEELSRIASVVNPTKKEKGRGACGVLTPKKWSICPHDLTADILREFIVTPMLIRW